MLGAVPIWPRDLDGHWMGTGPYYFGVDTGVYLNWDEPITRVRGLELGIPAKYCGG
jgi:hypothetical protein